MNYRPINEPCPKCQELMEALWFLLEVVEPSHNDELSVSLRPLNRKAAIENARRFLSAPSDIGGNK